ncbi:MAG: L-threonylcarbamoyladenylate synthase [bacterium]|nr:L-threonylcarbamoyladenylate synthase [bacterium]
MRIIDLKKERKEKVIREAVTVLLDGGLIVYPTETCYGLGADATNKKAVEKLLRYKTDRRGKPVSVAVCDRKMAEEYVTINETADNLYRHFLPGPLTVVSLSKGKTATALESANHTLGIRIPAYPLILEIIKKFGRPITSTSANTSGKKPPYGLNDFLKYTTEKRRGLVDLFLDAGTLPEKLPSTVVDATLNEPAVLRRGEIALPDIAGKVFITESEEETKTLAGEIFQKHRFLLKKSPLIFALQGELGSGKTQFVKGLARALGITENVVSPTFVVLREYPYKLPDRAGFLHHLDAWRLEKGEELLDLGLKNMLKPGDIVAVEWLQKVKPLLEKLEKEKKAIIVWVIIEYLSLKKRKIKYRSSGNSD